MTTVAIEGVLRRVYHHLSDPAPTNLDLLRALRPGGVLAIIDFPPMFSWLWPWSPNDTAGNRAGHGVAAELVVEEVTERRHAPVSRARPGILREQRPHRADRRG